MALGNFKQASKTASIIARQEQELGNYKVAHFLLYETIKDLEAQEVKVQVHCVQHFCYCTATFW